MVLEKNQHTTFQAMQAGTGSNRVPPVPCLLPHCSPGLAPLFGEASKEVEESPASHTLSAPKEPEHTQY